MKIGAICFCLSAALCTLLITKTIVVNYMYLNGNCKGPRRVGDMSKLTYQSNGAKCWFVSVHICSIHQHVWLSTRSTNCEWNGIRIVDSVSSERKLKRIAAAGMSLCSMFVPLLLNTRDAKDMKIQPNPRLSLASDAGCTWATPIAMWTTQSHFLGKRKLQKMYECNPYTEQRTSAFAKSKGKLSSCLRVCVCSVWQAVCQI